MKTFMTFIFLVYALVNVYSLRITNLRRLLSNSEAPYIPKVKLISSYDFNDYSFSEMKNNNEEENCVFTDNRMIHLNYNYYGNFN